MTGPTPKISVRDVPEARTADRQLLLRLAQQGIDPAQVVQEVGGQFRAGLLHGAARVGLAPGPRAA